MNKKILSLICFTLLGVFSTIAVNAQMKYETKFPDGGYLIKSVATGDSGEKFATGNGFWDLPVNAKKLFKSGDRITLQPVDLNKRLQLFTLKPLADGWYFISNTNGGYLDVTGGKDADGIRMQAYESNSSASQMFRFVHQGDGRFKIYTVWGRILSTVGQSTTNGTEINTWADHKTPAAEWYMYSFSLGKKYVPGDAAVIPPVKKQEPVKKPEPVKKLEPVSVIPEFFIVNKKFEYSAQGNMTSWKAKGTATVTNIKDNIAFVKVVSDFEGEDNTGKMVKKKQTEVMEISCSGDVYNAGDKVMGHNGRLEYGSSVLTLVGEGGSITLKVIVSNKPDFFINNKKFNFNYTTDISREDGTAEVKKITGNKVDLFIKSSGISSEENMGKETRKNYAKTLYFKDGYYYTENPESNKIKAKGKVNNLTLNLMYNEGYGPSFTIQTN